MLSLDMNLYNHNCRNYSRDVSKSCFRHHHTLNHANNNNSNDCKIILRDYPIHNANVVNTLPSFPTTVRHTRHSHNTPQTTFSDHSGNRSDSHDTRDGVEADGQGHGLRRLFQREPTPAHSRRPPHPPGCLQLPSPYDYDYDHHNITHTPCSITHSSKQQSHSHSVHASAFPISTMDKDNSIRVNSTTDHRHNHPDHSVMEAFFKNMVNDLLSDDSDSPSRNHDNGYGHNHDYVSSRSSPCSTISTTSTESFDNTSVMRTNALPPVSHSPPSMLDFDQSANSTVDQQSLQGQRVDNYYRHLHQHQQPLCHHQYAESSTPTLFTTSGQLMSSGRTPQDHIVMSGRMVRGRPFTSTLLSSISSSSSGYCGSSSSSSPSSSPPRRWAPVSSGETSPSDSSGGSDSDGGGCVDGFTTTTNSLQPLHYNLYVRSSGQQTPGTGPSTTAWTNTSKHPVNMESSRTRTSTPATTNTSTPSPTSHLTSPAPTTGDKIQHNHSHSRRVSVPTTTNTATSAGDENFNFVIAQTRQALGKLLPLGRKQHCKFCKNNKEHYGVYSTHVLNDEEGRVVCPILQKYTCPLCGATGSDAHTVKYCPWNEFDISDAMDKMLRE